MKKKETPLESFNRMKRESKVNKILSNLPVSGRSELLIDFIRWFRQHPEYENVTETPLVELYEKSINSR
jgi:hypothetical protein